MRGTDLGSRCDFAEDGTLPLVSEDILTLSPRQRYSQVSQADLR